MQIPDVLDTRSNLIDPDCSVYAQSISSKDSYGSGDAAEEGRNIEEKCCQCLNQEGLQGLEPHKRETYSEWTRWLEESARNLLFPASLPLRHSASQVNTGLLVTIELHAHRSGHRVGEGASSLSSIEIYDAEKVRRVHIEQVQLVPAVT
jgi:hypothetical protein